MFRQTQKQMSVLLIFILVLSSCPYLADGKGIFSKIGNGIKKTLNTIGDIATISGFILILAPVVIVSATLFSAALIVGSPIILPVLVLELTVKQEERRRIVI